MANHYTFGIGQPHTEVDDDLPPVMYDEATQSLVSGDRNSLIGGMSFSPTIGFSVGNNTVIDLYGGTVTAQGTKNFNLITTSNAVPSAADNGFDGVYFVCADEGQVGTGTLTRIAGAPAKLAWTAPGDTQGTQVDVTTLNSGVSGKYTLPSANGKNLYVVVHNARLPASGSTSVVVNNTTGAKAMTWSRTSNVLTVTETAHGRRAGDAVTLFGVNVLGCWFIDSVTDANTYVIRNDSRSNSSGSGTVFGVRNVTIRNGTIDARMASHTTTPDTFSTMGMILNSISDYTLENLTLQDCQKYCVYATHDTGRKIRNLKFDSQSDGVHINSPSRGGAIANLSGKCADNMLAFGVSDYVQYLINRPDEPGIHDNVIGATRGILAEQCFNPVRFYGSATWFVGDGTVDDVYGTVTTNVGITIKGDTTVVGAASQQNARNIRISNISLKPTAPGSGFNLVLCDMVGTIFGIEVDNFDATEPPTSTGCISVTQPVQSMTVSRPRCPDLYTAAGARRQWSGAALVSANNAAGAFGTLVCKDWQRFKSENSVVAPYGVLVVNSTNSIANLIFDNVDVEDVSTSGTRSVLVRNNGAITRVSFTRMTTSGWEWMRHTVSGAAAGNIVEIDGCRGIKGANAGVLYLTAFDFNPPGVYNAANVSGDATQLFRNAASTTPTVTMRLRGIDSAIAALAVPVAGPLFRVFAPDVSIDLSLLSRALAGQQALSTGNGTIPAGCLAVNDNTNAANSWKAVHNSTLVF